MWKQFLCKNSNKFSNQKIRYMDSQIKESIINQTNYFPEDTSLLIRLISLRDGYSEINQPICGHCGKLLNKITNGKLLKYCNSKCYSQTDEFKNNLKTVDYNKANDKRKKTMKEKYGFEYNSQRTDIHHIWNKSKLEGINNPALEILSSKESLYDLHINQKKSSLQISEELGVYYGTVIDWIEKHGIQYQYYHNGSQYERMIHNWLVENNIEFEINNRSLIHPKELDIYIPSKKLAIEINGFYWHGAKKKEDLKDARKRHQIKSLLCREKGINLIHLLDIDIRKNPDKVFSKLKFHLLNLERIGARKCDIRIIDYEQARFFCNVYHYDGYSASSIKLGLFYENELVSIMTFAKSRFDNSDYEIIRACSSKRIIGGVSKFIHFFINNYMKQNESLMTYVDIGNGFSGKSYESAGMLFEKITQPNYIWIGKDESILTRYQTQQKNLSNLFPDYINEKEDDFLLSKGYIKYYDSGNLVYRIVK